MAPSKQGGLPRASFSKLSFTWAVLISDRDAPEELFDKYQTKMGRINFHCKILMEINHYNSS